MCYPKSLFSQVVSQTIRISNVIRRSEGITNAEKEEIEYALAVIENSLHTKCNGGEPLHDISPECKT